MLPSRVYAKIDLDAIADNIDQIQKVIGKNVGIMAVIKANAYGHGAPQVARALQDKVFGFCVATAEEALALRDAGIENPILILGYIFPSVSEALIMENISMTVFDFESALSLSEIAVRLHKKVKVHIKLDTGMSRIGLMPTSESVDIVQKIAALPGIEIVGLFSHFARADEADKTSAKEQLRKFIEFSDALEAAGVTIPYHHICNSAGITEMPDARFNLVRCGIATYGLYPSEEVDKTLVKLKPAMSLYAKVTYVKTVPAGTPVSYGGTFVTVRPTTIATVSIGYADGYPRSLSGKGYVIIRGQKAPVLGRVCMDQCMVDVTGIPDVARGDVVTLMGQGIPTQTVAELSERLHYELICDIGVRVPRVYVGKKYKNGR